MEIAQLKKGTRVWCWWMSSLMLFTGKVSETRGYEFEDFGDKLIWIPADKIKDLQYRADR